MNDGVAWSFSYRGWFGCPGCPGCPGFGFGSPGCGSLGSGIAASLVLSRTWHNAAIAKAVPV
jgi:hypothetical protein